LEAAESRFAKLSQAFGPRVGLVHGRMKPAEKDLMMERFRGGDISILVATTVIEVGVDVTDATIIVIEHAERFGLAQLHQLRGRVGRGEKRSVCLLLYRAPLGETAKARLSIMRVTENGFRMPRRTCVCAAKAMSWARANPACPASGWRSPKCMVTCLRSRAMRRSWRSRATQIF